jgi:dipeptidyl aminopeptidase/acylaminoacyl peptidase
MANSISLLQSLMTAPGTHVDFMTYPRQHHGFTALADLQRLYARMLDWWTAHL